MIGKTLGHFKLLERIGAGGMGEVYRAHDEHLDRDVAVKILPSGVDRDPATRKHFRKEALTLAKLKHAHIGVVHDFGSEGAIDFLVMEFVPGTDLGEKLKEGPLSEDQLVPLGMQIASALEEAHEHGIVHRDLKPGNIMVTPKGEAKVLDFGLAKLVRVTDDVSTASMTASRGIAGTLPYMAPEQLRGSEVDGRMDLYALGATLYEAATGRRPFPQAQTSELITAILHKPAEAPRKINPDVSPELEKILLVALEKNPQHRYQTAHELHSDLARLRAGVAVAAVPRRRERTRRTVVAVGVMVALVATILRLLWTGGSESTIASIAVLPFTNISGQEEDELYADGITDGLITNLGRLSGLRKVISRQSIMQFKGTTVSLEDIAQQLGVDAVLEGSVLLSGGRVQVRANLVEAATERHLWGDSYDRELRDVLALLNDVTTSIVREVDVMLEPEQESRFANAPQVDPAAYRAYQRGLYFLQAVSIRKAVRHFEEAIRIDSVYAPAYAGLALCYQNRLAKEVLTKKEGIPLLKSAALKAISLDPSLATARIALASVHLHEWDFVEAERELQLALRLAPNSSLANYHYSLYLACVGRVNEAVAVAHRFVELDPLNPSSDWFLGYLYYRTGRYEDAIRELKDTKGTLRIVLAWVYAGVGRYDEAVAAFETAVQQSQPLHTSNPPWLATASMVYGLAGNRDRALEYLRQLQETAQTRSVDPTNYAMAYLGLGDYDRVFYWLRQAVDGQEVSSIRLKSLPLFTETLGSDPRYQELLDIVGYP